MGYAHSFDLADRTYTFAKSVRRFIRATPKDICNLEDLKQLTRASGSVGANYIEANEGFSTKDFYWPLKICRKEAKESIYWLKLVDLKSNQELKVEREALLKEATELLKIFSSIINKRPSNIS